MPVWILCHAASLAEKSDTFLMRHLLSIMLLFKPSLFLFSLFASLLCLDVMQVQSSLDETMLLTTALQGSWAASRSRINEKNTASSKPGYKKNAPNRLLTILKCTLEKLLDAVTHGNERTASQTAESISEEDKSKTFKVLRMILDRLQKDDMTLKAKWGEASIRAKFGQSFKGWKFVSEIVFNPIPFQKICKGIAKGGVNFS
jgi:hypothetical protein